MKAVLVAVLFVSMMGLSFNAFSFVENATHGYSNCMTCHYSPAGGDMLNEYGRSLSSELMSTWSRPGAERAFGGLVPENKWAKFGGDLRTLQRYLDTPFVEDRSLFLMQNNIEIGLKHKKLMLIGTLGTVQGPDGFLLDGNDTGSFLSERHYVLAQPTESTRFRAGKFRVNYGINDPNHNRPNKRALGFGSNSEQYNLEFSKFFDFGDLFLTYSFGRVDRTRRANDERSFSAKFSHYLGGKSKLGGSLLVGESGVSDRYLLGAHGITPLTEKSYVLYQVDYESKTTNAISTSFEDATNRLLANLRFGYEFFKGFKGYTLYDYQKGLNTDVADRVTAPGLGFQWFPFPHFEVQLEYQAMKNQQSPGTNHFGFVLFHTYY